MSFAERVERQQDAVFRTLGEDASWSGIAEPVRVIRREADEELRLERGAIVATGRVLRVRRAEVPEPAEGDEAQILDAAGAPVAGELFRVTGEPMLDRKGAWVCQIEPA